MWIHFLEMMGVHRGKKSRYIVAAGVTLLALVVRLTAAHWAQASSPFLFFAPAVMVAAWYGGLGPGLVATFAGAFLTNYFLLEPLHVFSLGSENLGRMTVFVIVGVQISWLSGAMRTAQHRAEADAEAARRSEKLYRTLAANFPDGFVCLFDRELRWTLVAGAGLEAAGLAREQMEGRSIAESLPAQTALLVEPMCLAAITGEAMQREIPHKERIYFCHALPLKPRDESTHVGMVILEDVTERAKARQALQWAHDNLEQRVQERTAELHFQKSLLEAQSQASADGIIAIAEDGRVIFINNRLTEMWRLNGSSMASNVQDLRQEMQKQLQLPQRDPLSAEKDELSVEQPEGPEELILADGRTIERYSRPILNSDGGSYGHVWFFRDITDRKRMQRQILEAGEHERQRIGQDLHDDLCQQLAGIACMGEALHKQLRKRQYGSAHEDSDAAMEIVESLQRANQRARDLAKGLQPVNFQRHGLVAALQDLCSAIGDVFKVKCAFQAEGVPSDVNETVGIQMYRICQEAISNAVRHGKAKHVLIDLFGVAGRLILTIEDDGKGIPQPLPEGGMGLYTMNYRARLMSGSFTVERNHPHGTIVTCSVPLQAPIVHTQQPDSPSRI
jgi:PAS domain S-box-containing protein